MYVVFVGFQNTASRGTGRRRDTSIIVSCGRPSAICFPRANALWLTAGKRGILVRHDNTMLCSARRVRLIRSLPLPLLLTDRPLAAFAMKHRFVFCSRVKGFTSPRAEHGHEAALECGTGVRLRLHEGVEPNAAPMVEVGSAASSMPTTASSSAPSKAPSPYKPTAGSMPVGVSKPCYLGRLGSREEPEPRRFRRILSHDWWTSLIDFRGQLAPFSPADLCITQVSVDVCLL